MSKKKPPKRKKTLAASKLQENLTKVITQYVTGKKYSPMTTKELFIALGIIPAQTTLCQKILKNLSKEGVITIKEKRWHAVKNNSTLMTGTLHLHVRGFGFVTADEPEKHPQDIFIPKGLTQGAVDKDHVEVEVFLDNVSEKGPEGKITKILKRARDTACGTVAEILSPKHALVIVPVLSLTKPVKAETPFEIQVGDRVLLKILSWGDTPHEAHCSVNKVLGQISDPSTDIPVAIEEYGVRSSFPTEAIEEAQAFSKTVTKKDKENRKDLTELTTFTIDPTTAKDFDDALSIKKREDGSYFLAVHIADVAHYVKPGSKLDEEASKRCNSTYFPGTCVPMLPEELSNHLCSLKPDVVRLTASVLMNFDREGDLQNYEITRSFIKSCKRFTYEEAKEVLDGKIKSPHKQDLELMVELCLLLKQKRLSRGSIDLGVAETVLDVDEKGNPVGFHTVEYDITHQLVEEYMLKANEIVATSLSQNGKMPLFRVHEPPSKENSEDFFALVRSLGFTLPSEPTAQDIQNIFHQAKDTPISAYLATSFIRSMKLAYYTQHNVGHYGLALEYYCHFTSPIRRYSDLVALRLLFNEIEPDDSLEAIALKCSEQERISFKAEMSVKNLKKLRLLQKYFAEDPFQVYEATVTKVKHFGLSFETKGSSFEGFLHISELEDDYFIFDEKKNIITGRSSGKIHKPGESIQVSLLSVDLIRQSTEWALVSSNPRKAPNKPSKKGRK